MYLHSLCCCSVRAGTPSEGEEKAGGPIGTLNSGELLGGEGASKESGEVFIANGALNALLDLAGDKGALKVFEHTGALNALKDAGTLNVFGACGALDSSERASCTIDSFDTVDLDTGTEDGVLDFVSILF
jgi:hypothetical protein